MSAMARRIALENIRARHSEFEEVGSRVVRQRSRAR
jgi:hypothetical protein